MYKLFYYPSNANLAPHMALAAIDVPYELILVDRKNEGQRSADYLALNPTGRIPTLIDGGRPVFETAAILLHLADKHPEAGLAPPVGHADRAEFLTWLFHLTNTIQPEYRVYYYPEQHVTDPANAADAKATSERRLGAMFDVVEAHLQGRHRMVGGTTTVADFLLLMLIRWGRGFARPPKSLPNLGRVAASLAEEPAVRRAYEEEGLAQPWY